MLFSSQNTARPTTKIQIFNLMKNLLVISERGGVLSLRLINECLSEAGLCLNENEIMGMAAYLKTKMMLADMKVNAHKKA